MNRTPVRVSPLAQGDAKDAVQWSRGQFGASAARRYALLLDQALLDVSTVPATFDRGHPDLPGTLFVWHLSLSRKRTPPPPVGRPRHLLVYRRHTSHIQILRILHDSRDLPAHV